MTRTPTTARKAETMKTYEVSEHKTDRHTVTVDARDEWSAVRKAHGQITGRRSRGLVMWNGLVASIDGVEYNKPVVM